MNARLAVRSQSATLLPPSPLSLLPDAIRVNSKSCFWRDNFSLTWGLRIGMFKGRLMGISADDFARKIGVEGWDAA